MIMKVSIAVAELCDTPTLLGQRKIDGGIVAPPAFFQVHASRTVEQFADIGPRVVHERRIAPMVVLHPLVAEAPFRVSKIAVPLHEQFVLGQRCALERGASTGYSLLIHKETDEHGVVAALAPRMVPFDFCLWVAVLGSKREDFVGC